MRYTTFGRQTGLRVSELALGTGSFGTGWGHGAEPAEARRLFDRYLEAGGNFLDCADTYQNGEAETLLGEFIAADRDRLVVASKYTLGVERQGRHRRHRQQPQGDDGLGRGQPEAAQDRPSRPLLGAHGRRADAGRGDRARLRRSRACRQDPLCWPVRLPRLARGARRHARRIARLGADRRPADRIQPGRAHARPRAAADGRGAGHGRGALVAARRRLPHRQVPPRRGGPAAASGHAGPRRHHRAEEADPGHGAGGGGGARRRSRARSRSPGCATARRGPRPP